MGFLQNLKRAFRQTKSVAGVELMTQTGNSYYTWRGSVYQSDIVRACIRPKAKAVGKLVAKHLKRTLDAEGHESLTVNPSNSIKFLLEEPNPLMSGQVMLEKMATQLALNSNAFALIVRDDMGTPVEIYPIVPMTVEALYDERGALLLRFQLANNRIFTFPYTDIIHLRQDFNENDIFGTPIAPALSPLLEVVTTTDQGVINAIKNSSVVRWLLKFSNSMRSDDLKKQSQEFAKSFLSTSEGMGVAAVDAKADAQQISPTDYVPNAAQMDRTSQRIFDLFNTNIAIVEANYTETQYNAYFDAEIEPIETQLGNEFSRKLFTRRERVFGNKIVFEASAWDAASITTKLNLVSLVDRGALTPNEWRATFNLAPIAGGDIPLRRLDTATVQDEGEKVEKGGEENGED